MPELPEVETVKRELEKTLLNQKLLTPRIYFKKVIQTSYDEYIKNINNVSVTSISREGKFLIIHLDNKHKILFHLRMEGKLFVVDKDKHTLKHLSLFIPFENNKGLAFYDTRKFGVTYYLKEEELGPLEKLGLEPFEINDPNYLIKSYSKSNKYIKELLLDQNIMCGLGNIYADEVLFAASISPFKKGKDISFSDAKKIIEESKRILKEAIINNGSTIRTYQASTKVHGSFQEFLKVYSKEHTLCPKCKKVNIEVRKVGGRSTHYCPICQHSGISIALTGLISTGKTTVLNIFKHNGFITFSCDEEVNKLYKLESFKKIIKKQFPTIIVDNEINKEKVLEKLLNDKKFYKEYQALIFKIIKERINNFIISNDNKNKVIEVPLLFNAKMEKDFTYLIGVESSHNEEFLKQRDNKLYLDKLKLNKLNKYLERKHLLDYVITNDGDVDELNKNCNIIIKKVLGRE